MSKLSVTRKAHPRSLLLPHFLKLILQNQVEDEKSIAEATELSDKAEKVEGEEIHGEFEVFRQLTAMKSRSEAEVAYDEPTEMEVTTTAGKMFLAKDPSRRLANPNPIVEISEAVHRRWSRTVWRQELNNIEPVYRLPALILRRFRYIRDVEPTRIGPGTYDADNYHEIQQKKRSGTTRGVLQKCGDRFPKEKTDADPTPGPGSYGDPYGTYERALDKSKHVGRVTLLESGPCNVRTVMEVQQHNPGPGQYNLKPGIDEFLEKRFSKKGPYNLYTPSRDVIPYGYFQTRSSKHPGPGQYNIRATLKQELNSCCNHYKGKLAPIERFRKITGERTTLVSPLWPSSEERPSPAHYTPELFFKEVKPFKYAFNTASPARPDQASNYDMAPDKYRPELWDRKKILVGQGWESDFISKTGRLDLLKMQVYGERVRGKDIPHHQRVVEPKDRDVSKIYCKSWKS